MVLWSRCDSQTSARPDKRLADFNRWILSYPRSHDVEVLSTLQWDPLARGSVSEVTILHAQLAVEAHVRAIGDRQQWLVHVCNLESDKLPNTTPNGHELATPLAQVGYVSSIGHLILHTFS